MFRRLLTLFCALLSLQYVGAQVTTFSGSPLRTSIDTKLLDEEFFEYEVYRLDATAIYNFVQQDPAEISQIQINLGTSHALGLEIYEHRIRAANYVVRAATEDGVQPVEQSSAVTYRGLLVNDPTSEVRLTLHDDFIYGFMQDGDGQMLFIEPLNKFVKGVGNDYFVVYYAKDVIPNKGKVCGVEAMSNYAPQHDHPHDEVSKPEDEPETGFCLEVEIAIASDFLMFQEFGSVTAVENHAIGVMNNVQNNYDDEFDDELDYVIVEQFVATSAAADPWTSSTNAGTLLNSFTNWGPNGFSQTHDVASLWTDRDLNGGTIGIAWLSAVCTNNRYHVLQNFSSNASLLRVLKAHELGHNWSCTHDGSGSGFIMAPSVNNTNTWSTQSQNQVNSFVPTRNCLAFCPPPIPPTPLFMADFNLLCEGSMVTFWDQSINGPTSWSWSFPGGTPSSSTERNPTVTYNSSGSYNVTLTVSNANGSNSLTQNGVINVVPFGGTDFFFFEDFETGAPGWTIENPDNDETWTFETVGGTRQGNTAMRMNNFNYNAPGQRDALVSPVIDFFGRENVELEIEYAYARYNSQFRDSLVVLVSKNGGSTYTRVFADTENGNGNFATHPQTTSSFNPDEESDWCYATTFGNDCLVLDLDAYSGETDVVIKIENVNGYGNRMYIDNIRLKSDCEAIDPPIADFSVNPTFGCAPLQVQLTDLSQNNPITWNWQMPGAVPPASTQQNPLIAYTSPGSYTITLTVTNPAGVDTKVETNIVVVETTPVADFDFTTNGLTATFTNQSTPNVDNFFWDFGDGNSSTLENPVHTYAQDGAYVVNLTVTNECGTSTYPSVVTVVTPPTAAFTANPTSGCANLTVQFADLSSPNTTDWLWTFPGGTPNTSTDQNPTVVYTTPGVYDVTLEVSNSAGSDVITEVGYITVEGLPNPSFTYTVDENEVTFTNTSTNADTYSWDFGDGNTSTEENPIHIYAADGLYTVILTATNACGSTTSQQSVLIQTEPLAGFSADVTEGCAPLTVQFTDESSSNVLSWNWTFEGGDPATSNDQNPTVTYLNPGTYSVTLTVANSSGNNTFVATDYITVNDVPTASFTSSVDVFEVTFTNTSTNADTYSWDFGDGNTSTEENPVHTYAQDGTYTVELTATNECGSVTTTEVIEITSLPVAAFSSDVTTGCAPLTVMFMDESSSNTTSWAWTFPGGSPSTSTEQNPTVVYNTAGVYDVTLVATNSEGSSNVTQTGYIVVEDVPSAGFTSSVNGNEVTFTNTSTNADTYSWDFGDGNSSTEENPVHIYAQDGVYTVVLTATNACGSVTFTEEITILTPPQAGFTADVTTGCAPLTVMFMDMSSSNATSWNWTFPGGTPSSSTEQNPTVVYNSAGAYNVTLEVTNAAGSSTLTESQFIVVDDVPSASFTQAANGLEVTFTNTSTNADTYSWDFGDGNTSTEENPVHTYAQDGTYTVVLTATNACGSVTESVEITVVTPPSAGFSADVTEGCAPLIVQFSDESSQNATAWAWTFEGGDPATSTEQNPTVTYLQAGTYGVTLTVSNAAGNSTFTESSYINVNDLPTAGFTSVTNALEVTFTNTSTNADSYSWDFGDGNTSTEENPVHTYAQDGNYAVVLTATNACGSVNFTQVVEVATPPTAGFSADVTEGCAPLTVQFTDESSNNVTTWAWTFEGGDPATSTEQNPSVTYLQAGTYGVTLTVGNASGNSTMIEANYIVVDDVPTVGFTTAIDELEATFTNTSTNADSYSWDFGDGNTSTEENPVHTYAEDGSYTVVLTATNACGSATFTQVVEVATPPTAGFSADVTEGCVPLIVQFTDESSSNVTAWSWTFEGGTPATSNDPNPTVTYNTAGTYAVTLEVSNAEGTNTITVDDYIIVNDVPEANFDVSVTDFTATFTNTSINADTYSWNFGDGNTSNLPNPVHVYAEDGAYTVTLTATNGCGSETINLLVIISASGPIAFFQADQEEGCAPLVVQFENLSSDNAESFSWTFEGGDPMTSNDENPTVTYGSAGTYDVTLIAFNTNGNDTLVLEDYIVVEEVPEASFSFSANGATVDFTNTSTSNADSFSWNFGDGNTSTDPQPTHTYSQIGTFTVSLIATNECGSNTFTQVIEVMMDLPVASFSADPVEGCIPLTVQFTDSSTGNPTSWNWTFDGGDPATSTDQNPVVVYDEPGVYNVSLQVFNLAGSNTIVQNQMIEVGAAPEAAFSYVVDQTTVEFTNETVGVGTYLWDFGDGNTSTMVSPTHTYTDGGTYTVTLTVTNNCGTTTFTETISVEPNSVFDVEWLDEFKLFPNPNDGQFFVEMTGQPAYDAPVRIRIYSVIGQEILREEHSFATGQLSRRYDLNNLAQGVYVFELSLGESTIVRKVVVE
jgi:PKD repeat protein